MGDPLSECDEWLHERITAGNEKTVQNRVKKETVSINQCLNGLQKIRKRVKYGIHPTAVDEKSFPDTVKSSFRNAKRFA